MLDMLKLCKTGSIVFTNGDLDGWAGGSFQSFKELQAAIAAGSMSQRHSGKGWWDDGDAAKRIAFVTYKGASHCTGAELRHTCRCIFGRTLHACTAAELECWFIALRPADQ
jgi:hypothetical protein